MSDINAFKRQMADALARKGLTFAEPVSDSTPYEALGIGDVVALGMVTGHTFVFEHLVPEVADDYPDQAWFSRSSPFGMVVVNNRVHLIMDAQTGFVQTDVRALMSAQQCTDLARLLLNAALHLAVQQAQPAVEVEGGAV